MRFVAHWGCGGRVVSTSWGESLVPTGTGPGERRVRRASLGFGSDERSTLERAAGKRARRPVDLYEYQARDLFAAHGVPVCRADRRDARGGRAAARELGGTVVVKAQVKTGGRGKAGGVKLAELARRGAGAGRGDPRAWTSRATPCTGC